MRDLKERSSTIIGYLFIFGTIFFTVYGQIVLKWQVSEAGALPAENIDRLWFLVRLLLNPWVISGIGAGFLALLSWIFALTQFELSYAYPFTTLGFVFVILFGILIFQERVNWPKIIGVLLIVAGIIVGSRG